jgi:short-subunit dehydrogenase
MPAEPSRRRRAATFPLRDGVAVVTGAASGIGAALAGTLAQRGCNLALADVNAAGLHDTAASARSHGVRVSEHRLDVADADAVAAFPDAVLAEHGRVNVLVNNAGVALGGTFEQVSAADFEWLFSINFWGVVRMTRAFLPLLRREDAAQLVNLSSLFGIIAPPGQVAYAASKFAVRGFSEALRHELEASPIGVTVVHPGGVRTAIATSARHAGMTDAERGAAAKASATLLRLPPEAAAERITRGIERREKRVLVGRDAQQMALVQRMFPVGYWSVVARFIEGRVRRGAAHG